MPTGIYKRKPVSEETRRKLSAFQKGRFHKKTGPPSEETRKKISASLMGHAVSEKVKMQLVGNSYTKGLSSWIKGKKHSVKTLEKMRLAHSLNPQLRGEKSPNWKGGRKASLIRTMPRKLHYNLLRYSLKKHAIGAHTFGEWELLKKQYGNICPCCLKKEPNIVLTEDHIIPLIKGGSNYIENIQPLCKSCNSRKQAKIITKYPIPII